MLTRNRGKSKSVVEMLGLVKRTKRRAINSASSPYQKNNGTKTTTRISRKDTFVRQSKMRLSSDSLEQSVTEGAEDTIPFRLSFNSRQHDVVSQADCLPDANNKAYKLTDKATQQMLREISSTGRLFISREKYKQHAKDVADKLSNLEKASDPEVLLKGPRQTELFTKIVGALSEINEDLDKKDAFLASQRLLRPNMRLFLRPRRECLAVARSFKRVKSYLRPNPRRTRYASAVTTSRRRTGVDRNARVAAKKLAQAKSQAAAAQVLRQTSGDKKITEVRRGRPRKSQTQDSANPTTASPTVTIQTRHKQFGNISKHIDWKYCYSATDYTLRSSRTETIASRKRRAQATQANLDENEVHVRDQGEVGEQSETQEEQNFVEEPHHKVDLDDSEPERHADVERKVTFHSRSPVAGSYSRPSTGRSSHRELGNNAVRRRGAFATPRLSGASGEPEPPRARNVRRADNPQLSVLERLVLGFVDCRVMVDDNLNSISVKGLSEKEMRVLLLRAENAHFVTNNVSIYDENNEKKYGVILRIPSTKPSAAATESRSAENSSQSQQQSDSSLETGNQQDFPEEEANEDLSFSGDEVDWNTDYRRRTTQQHYQRPSPLDRFRTPRFNRVRSPRPSHPPNSSIERQSGGTEGEGSAESTTPHPALPLFRRHRRFVRKVYTGTSTVPKILNRRTLINRPQAPTNSVGGGSVPQPQVHSAPSFLSSHPVNNQPVVMQLDAQAVPVSVAENPVPSSMSPLADKETRVTSAESTNVVMNVSSAPSPQVPGNPDSLQLSSEQFNPASAMSASQLLRLKRNQDENQHQQARLPLTTSITPVAVTSSQTITSVAMATPIVQVSPSVQQQQLSLQHPQFRNQRKLNPAQGLRVETGGPVNHNVDLDDGTDFELSTTSLPPQLPLPQQPMSVTPTLPTPAHPLQTVTVFSPPPTQSITPHPSGFFSTPGFIPSIRPAIVSVVRPVASVLPSRSTTTIITGATTDGSFLTGRPLVATPVTRRDISPPSSTNGNSESRRPVVHKCHSIRRLSPKSSPIPENNGTAPAATMTAKPSANSQLLKSLLQNGAHNSPGCTNSLLSLSSTQLQSRPNPLSTSSRVLPGGSQVVSPQVGPAHQSRGTWQLGGRAIVVGASVIKPTFSAPRSSTPLSTSQPTAAASIPPQDSNESAQFY